MYDSSRSMWVGLSLFTLGLAAVAFSMPAFAAEHAPEPLKGGASATLESLKVGRGTFLRVGAFDFMRGIGLLPTRTCRSRGAAVAGVSQVANALTPLRGGSSCISDPSYDCINTCAIYEDVRPTGAGYCFDSVCPMYFCQNYKKDQNCCVCTRVGGQCDGCPRDTACVS